MSDPDDRDLLAAEYVLGTLDAVERAEAEARLLAGDADLAGAVAAWEDRLAPLTDALPGVMPPSSVFDALVAQLFGGAVAGDAARPGATVAVLRRRVLRWQAATGGLALLAASLLAWVAVRDMRSAAEGPRFVAVLQRDAGTPAILLDIDLTTRRLTVRPLAAAAPAGRAYELWIIDPALGAPRSLGVLPAGAGMQESLSDYDPAVITGATYAVTVEAAGGSPTGRPTGTPILTGKLAASPS